TAASKPSTAARLVLDGGDGTGAFASIGRSSRRERQGEVTDGDGAVGVSGTVNASAGDIVLAGERVENRGVIGAVDGYVGLAGGNDVLYQSQGDQRIFVEAGEGGHEQNAGKIRSAAAELRAHGSVAALSVQNDGVIRSTGIEVVNGRVILNGGTGNIDNTATWEKDADWGHRGDIEVMREFIYPTEYDPSELANGSDHKIEGGTALNFTGGTAVRSYTQLGHGGYDADGNQSGDITVHSTGGGLSIRAGGTLESLGSTPGTPAETQTGEQVSARIGYGGDGATDDLAMVVPGRKRTSGMQGDISVFAGGDITLLGGERFQNGGAPAAAESSAKVTLDGVNVFIDGVENSGSNGDPRMGVGTHTATPSPAVRSFDQVGHGGEHWVANSDSGNIVVNSDSDDDSVSEGDFKLGHPFTQIGPGSYDQEVNVGSLLDSQSQLGYAGQWRSPMQIEHYGSFAEREVGNAGNINVEATGGGNQGVQGGWDIDNADGDQDWYTGREGEVEAIAQNEGYDFDADGVGALPLHRPSSDLSLQAGFGDNAHARVGKMPNINLDAGGEVQVVAGDFIEQKHAGSFTEDIDADGDKDWAEGTDGKITVVATNGSTAIEVLEAGKLEAEGVIGGRVRLNGEDHLVAETSAVEASGSNGGGTVNLSAGDQIFVAGTAHAVGIDGDGGSIEVTGSDVLVEPTAVIDADGSTGGGAFIGGGFQGKGSDFRKSQQSAAAEAKNGLGAGALSYWYGEESGAADQIGNGGLNSNGDAFAQLGYRNTRRIQEGGAPTPAQDSNIQVETQNGNTKSATEPRIMGHGGQSYGNWNTTQIGHGGFVEGSELQTGVEESQNHFDYTKVDAKASVTTSGKDNVSFDVDIDHELAGDGMFAMVPDVAKRGIIRRQELVAKADEKALRGQRLLEKGDLRGAANELKEALDLLPDAPVVQERVEEYESMLADTNGRLQRQYVNQERDTQSNGLAEATLDADDNDFLFDGNSNAAVVNYGKIQTADKGEIYFVDHDIQKHGHLGAPDGRVILAGGSDVLIQERPNGNAFVDGTTSGGANFLFNGETEAADVQLHARGGNPYGMAVQVLGRVRATTAENIGGRVVLQAEGGAGVNVSDAAEVDLRGQDGNPYGMAVLVNGAPVKRLKQVQFPEKSAAAEALSTFSLNVSDVSFKLAQAALAEGQKPEKEKIRIEEFINAFDYGDPMPSASERVACQHEQAIHPFNASRNLLRISMRTAEAGRSSSTPLRLTILLDASGSMERADRRESVKRALSLLSQQLHEGDQVNVIGFARQSKLLAEQLTGPSLSGVLSNIFTNTASEGGTNLEAALNMALEKANEFKSDDAQNRVVLLTDGAANLGDAAPERLAKIVEQMRKDGIAFDAAGVGAEGLNDEVLEALTRKGDGRYYFLNRPEDADDSFAQQIAGALRPAAMNVKVQVEFNPKRVGKYKLLGYEKHRLKKEDFRNDAVDAAELAAAEAGVALYHFEPLPEGEGDVGTVSVRFRDMSTGKMVERRWPIPYEPTAPRLDDAKPSIRIATAAAMLAGKLKDDPVADAAELSELANIIRQLPPMFRHDKQVQQLLTMIERFR
ncbi:MAG: von Willebrand factor type A domain-containing protein, partial [Verrucomicrobiota bacterium]